MFLNACFSGYGRVSCGRDPWFVVADPSRRATPADFGETLAPTTPLFGVERTSLIFLGGYVAMFEKVRKGFSCEHLPWL